MANLCIKTPSSAIQVLIFQLLVLRPRPNNHHLEATNPTLNETLFCCYVGPIIYWWPKQWHAVFARGGCIWYQNDNKSSGLCSKFSWYSNQWLVSLESLQVVVRTKSICLVGAKSDKIWWWRPNREFHRHAHRPSEAMHSVKSRDSSVTLCASMTSWHRDITTLRLCASLILRHCEPDTDIVQDSTFHSLTPIWVHQGATQSLSWTC